MDIELAPDGNTLNSLGARDRVQLDLPAGPDTPARRIKSVTLEARAEPGKPGCRRRASSIKVEFRETRPAQGDQPALDRLVKSRVLDAKVQEGMSQIDEALFNEGVTDRRTAPRTRPGRRWPTTSRRGDRAHRAGGAGAAGHVRERRSRDD